MPTANDQRSIRSPEAASVPRPGGASRRRYDIEADWILMSTCNFRCDYCSWGELLGAKIQPLAGIDRIASFFDDTGLTWLLHLTGGEPFVYPRFVELCGLLTRRHLINVNTNADSPRVRQFVDTIDPARVDYVHCAVHPAERARHSGTDRFVGNVIALKGAGFDVFVSCVMTPDVMADFSAIWDFYGAAGIHVIPKALRGPHRGLDYPESYSPSQRECFIGYSDRARLALASQFARRSEAPTINPLMDAGLFLHKIPDYRSRMCQAGHRFVRIHANGDIVRCGPGDVLGNVASGRFDRRPGPSPCADVECPYFCEKYAAPAAPGARLATVAVRRSDNLRAAPVEHRVPRG